MWHLLQKYMKTELRVLMFHELWMQVCLEPGSTILQAHSTGAQGFVELNYILQGGL